jgi:hypothetical protein
MHVVERIGFGILDKALFLALFPFQNPPNQEQANGMDKVAASFLVFQFNPNALRGEARLRTHQADDGISQSNESRLSIGPDKRSQGQTEDHVSAPVQRRIGVRFAASSRGIFESRWAR